MAGERIGRYVGGGDISGHEDSGGEGKEVGPPHLTQVLVVHDGGEATEVERAGGKERKEEDRRILLRESKRYSVGNGTELSMVEGYRVHDDFVAWRPLMLLGSPA
ncbi:hypothetical protein GH714_025803 [Hevea brasiliensis]|uniref:Uncharacterized protein n=1 Tax=Hevea brasiliensis TaxID=3981 RepID=A0A6A6KTS6_HEVBR|nr:hypothetical protein GH714_025803 [Hevea brasiliensis]